MNLKNIFLWGLVCSLIVSGLLGIGIFLFADFHPREVKILFSTLDVGACSLAGLCCSTILDTRFRWFSVGGMLISMACMAMLLFTIWNYERIDNYDLLLSQVVLTGTCAHVSLILLSKAATPRVMYVLVATVASIAIVGIMLLRLIWANEVTELFYRLLGVFGILDVLGTIISPILGKTQRYEDVLES